MNISKVKMLEEHPAHFVMHDGKSPFKVAKSGLSEAMHGKLRAMAPQKLADGGEALSSQLPPQFSSQPPPTYSLNLDGMNPLTAADVQAAMPQRPSMTGADLGLQNAPPGASFSMPPPDLGLEQPKNSGLKNPPQLSKTNEHTERVMVPTGEMANDGSRVAKEQEGFVNNPLPVLRAGWSPPTAAPAAMAPSQPGTRRGAPSIDSVPGAGDQAEAVKQKQAAFDAQYSAEASQARSVAAAKDAYQTQQEHDAIARRDRDARAHQAGMDALSKVQSVADEARNVDTTIDPGRYWGSRSTPQKIGNIIGLILGALGARPDGVNVAAQMLDKAIDRDIDAQKAEHGLRLQKGKAAIDAATSMYAMHHQMLQDDVAADAATRASEKELSANKIDTIIASTGDPLLKSRLMALKADMLAGAGKDKEAVYFKVKDQSTKQQIADADTTRANAEMVRAGKTGAPKAGKNAELVKGAQQAARDLEQELTTNPTSPRIGQLRASLKLHLNKLQGGRFNEEINAMNEALIPGNEGWSTWQRAQGAMSPDAVREKFSILDKHIAATGNMAPNPEPGSDE